MNENAAATELARELFAPLGPLRVRRMFGGAGVYLDDAMFALIGDGRIWMKTDDALARAYEAAGSAPFVYTSKKGGAQTVMSYWRLPDSALDDADEALDWARRSLEPAQAAAVKRRR